MPVIDASDNGYRTPRCSIINIYRRLYTRFNTIQISFNREVVNSAMSRSGCLLLLFSPERMVELFHIFIVIRIGSIHANSIFLLYKSARLRTVRTRRPRCHAPGPMNKALANCVMCQHN